MKSTRMLLVLTVLAAMLPTAAQAQLLTFTKSFSTSSVAVSAFNVLTFTIGGGDGVSTAVGFTDSLPAGLSISSQVVATNTCGGALIIANVPGGFSSIALSGGTVASGPATCNVTVGIQGDIVGIKNNSATGTGNLAGLIATATTKVVAPVFTKSFSPTTIFVGQTSMLTLTLTNNETPLIFGAITGFVDNLPPGLAVGAVASNTCAATVATTASSVVLTQAGADNLPPGSCSIVVSVTGITTGTKVNTAIGNRSLTGQNPTATLNVLIPPDAFQVRYAANLTSGDSVINLTNSGANGASLTGPGFASAVGNICVNVYGFSPDEQLISCCSCLITPNGLVSLSVKDDVINNTLTGVKPNSVVVKLVNTGAGPTYTGTKCTNSAATAGSAAFPLAQGLLAFGTTIHIAPVAGTFGVTETPFRAATLSPDELASITNRCTNIIGNGSGFGICKSCRAGGLAAN